MKNKLILLPLLCFCFLMVFLLKGLFSDPRERDSALIDRPLPNFQLPDLYDPNRMHSQNSIKGQAYLLNVWGTWCTTCQYELPFLTKLKQEYGVKIIGLYYDRDHAPEFGVYADVNKIQFEVKQMLAQLGDPYAFNILDLERDLSLNLGVTGAPETFVIDAKGIVKVHHMGDINEQIWRDKIAPIWNSLDSGGQ